MRNVLFWVVIGLLVGMSASVHAAPTLLPDADAILAVDWNADGTQIAYVLGSGTVEVVDAQSGVTRFSFEGDPPGQWAAIDWHPLDNAILAAGVGNQVYVWDISTAQLLETLQAGSPDNLAHLESGVFPESIYSVAWSPDGSRLATGSLNEVVRVWDTSTWDMVLDTRVSQGGVIGWGLDTTKLYAGVALSMATIDLSTGQVRMLGPNTVQPGAISTLDVSPDGTAIIDGTILSDITVWSITGEIVLYIKIYDNDVTFDPLVTAINMVRWHPGGVLFATGGADGTVRIWNSLTGQEIRTIQEEGPVYALAWNPEGTKLVYGDSDGGLAIIDAPLPPTASAGPDQTLTDTDASGGELVTLDGSGSSDPDGTIVGYSWTENEVEIATGVTPTIELAVGVHTLTLTVTDDDGLPASDEVVITVEAPSPG